MSQETGKRRIPRFDRRRVHQECSRKKGFATTREVNKILHKNSKLGRLELSYYKCEFCGKYHLTKKPVRSRF